MNLVQHLGMAFLLLGFMSQPSSGQLITGGKPGNRYVDIVPDFNHVCYPPQGSETCGPRDFFLDLDGDTKMDVHFNMYKTGLTGVTFPINLIYPMRNCAILSDTVWKDPFGAPMLFFKANGLPEGTTVDSTGAFVPDSMIVEYPLPGGGTGDSIHHFSRKLSFRDSSVSSQAGYYLDRPVPGVVSDWPSNSTWKYLVVKLSSAKLAWIRISSGTPNLIADFACSGDTGSFVFTGKTILQSQSKLPFLIQGENGTWQLKTSGLAGNVQFMDLTCRKLADYRISSQDQSITMPSVPGWVLFFGDGTFWRGFKP